MSGHSKFHNIKLRKGKADAQRGALFTKLSKEIIVAVRSGSSDPEANYRLKVAVEKARENNMPQENIKRAISRAAGQSDAAAIEELRYEGYGPHGVAVVADAATDNRNRTAGELRFLFSKHGGTLGESGSVAWMFEPLGLVEVDPHGRSEDRLTEDVLVDGVEDIEFDVNDAVVYTQPTALAAVRDAIAQRGMNVRDAYLGMRAKTKIELHGPQLSQAFAFLEALDDHEDVQRVFSTLDLSDAAVAEALA